MKNILFRMLDLFIPFFTLYLSVYVTDLPDFNEQYLNMAIFASFLMLLLNEVRSSYNMSNNNRTLSRSLELTFESWGVVVLTLITYLYIIGSSHLVARRAIIVWLIISPVLILALKLLVSRFYSRYSRPIILLCIGNELNFTSLESERIVSSNIIIHHCPSVMSSDLPKNINSIIFNYPDAPSMDEVKKLTHLELSGIKLISTNEFYERYLRKCFIPYSMKNIEFLNDIQKPRNISAFIKILVDTVMVLVLLFLSFPLFFVSLIMIKRQSPGPALFEQTRVGCMMKPFTVIKFRSMHLNAAFSPYTSKEDSRVFSYGKLMRKARIDELPQLWNIIRGDMNFIGPRAEWDILVESYEQEIPYYNERHLVKPGITGWAQVMYPYGANTEDARQKLMYDLYYIKHWSLWLELETIIRTVGVVFARKGQ